MKKELNDLFEKIEFERRRWRAPLFIIGAGVSATKVPLMDEIFQYFCDMNGLPPEVIMDALKLRINKQYQSRATAANFFSILQTSKDHAIKQAWNSFTRDFLEGRLRQNSGGLRTQLWKLEPTAFHKKVAEQVVRDYLPGVCLSLNYDGLTAKAIKKIALEKNESKTLRKEPMDPLYPCRILTTQDEIKERYARNSKADDFYPIIKLKGDIFNAVCMMEGCKYHNQRIPIYEISLTSNEADTRADNNKSAQNQLSTLPSRNQPNHFVGSKYEDIMECKGCGQIRRIEIDFPGYRTKELETNKVIEMIYRFIVPSLSCIVVCGVSGNWDFEIVEFLRVCAMERGLKIYCLDMEKPPLLQYHVSWAISNIIDDKANFIPIEIDFSKFESMTGEAP